MGNGLDRAGYLQVGKVCNATILTSTMSSTTCTYAEGWAGFEVISSGCAIGGITAAGITGSSLISSGTTFPTGAYIGGGPITYIKISTKSTGHKLMAYRRILL